MEAHFKTGVRERLASAEHLVVELGCGTNKRFPDAIGIDQHDFEGVDIVCDLNAGIPLEDASVHEIRSHHFLEHVGDLAGALDEQLRVLVPGGVAIHTVPHFSNPYFYSDYTHRVFFGLYTFSYFSKSTGPFKRRVPQFYNALDLVVEDIELRFRTQLGKPRRYLKSFVQYLVNRSTWGKELYEELFCYWFPCYELVCRLRKPDGEA